MKLFLNFCIFIALFLPTTLLGQNLNKKQDSIMLRKIYSEALENGQAYANLKELCKNVGDRLSGSLGAKMAIKWGVRKLKSYPFDSVYLQKVMVPHWERGTREECYYIEKSGRIRPLNVLAIGGSVGTHGIMEGELVLFKTLEGLKKADPQKVKGKIVFVAQHMDQKFINAIHSYGAAYPIRGHSAIIAAQKGAKAVVIRTLSLSENDFPNTGTMAYSDTIKKIPAAALSTKDATALEKYMERTEEAPTLYLKMGCKWFPDVASYNIIAQIKGTKYPNQIITIGAHLDSWDVGEGAHDDGAGIVGSMEALRILETLNYQPKHTLRVVFFMNEENGNRGGKMYAKKAKESGEEHILAIESDEGGFSPRGFTIDGNPKAYQFAQKIKPLFAPYFVPYFEKGYTGVDITPLKYKFKEIGLFELVPDSQRYFNIHHNNNDVFENINKRELHLGAAAMSSLLYLLDKYYSK